MSQHFNNKFSRLLTYLYTISLLIGQIWDISLYFAFVFANSPCLRVIFSLTSEYTFSVDKERIMKKNIFLWQLGGLTFSAILGTLFHFLLEWTGLQFLAPICAINESTWEHMKLLFFPTLFYTIFQSFFAKEYKNFWSVKLIGTCLGLITIPMLFYTCIGTFGFSPAWYNILIFFLALGVTYFTEYALFMAKKQIKPFNLLAIFLFIVIVCAFVVFTYSPPNIPLFLPPTVE